MKPLSRLNPFHLPLINPIWIPCLILFASGYVLAFRLPLPPGLKQISVQTNRAIKGLDDFDLFVNRIADSQPDLPAAVYVQGVLQFPIVQQPSEDPIYVSDKPGMITQYRDAAQNGVIGLLAHNFLSGALFSQLTTGQEVLVIYGDRTVRRYQVTSIHQFQKLNPSDVYSDYLDLSDGKKLTSSQVFDLFYRGAEHVTFQTCLKEGPIWNWGLLIIIALPLEKQDP
jgi:hypothetical protein